MGFWVCKLWWCLIFNLICLVIELRVCVCLSVVGPLVLAVEAIGLWWCLSLSLTNNHTQMLNTKTTHKRWTQNHRLKPHGKQYNHTPTDQRVWEVRHNLPVNAETHSSGNDTPNGEKVSSSKGLTEAGLDVFFAYSSVLMVVWSVVGRWNSFQKSTLHYMHWFHL